MTLVVAHRTGPPAGPENSRSGIAAAARVGADAVEVDVRLSRDGTPVLMHDRTSWRTARWPLPVSWTSAARFGRLRFRGTNEHPPTFEQALRVVPPELFVAVDLKDDRAVEAAVATWRSVEPRPRVSFWSRNPERVRWLAQAEPAVERALLRNTRRRSEHLDYLDDAVACGAHAVSVLHHALTPDILTSAHDRGLVVYTWLRSTEEHHDHADADVDGVVTDWPGLARDCFGPHES